MATTLQKIAEIEAEVCFLDLFFVKKHLVIRKND